MECTPRLIAVGVGPGDPELVTIKAVRVLETADLILVPDTGGPTTTGRASAIVAAACPGATGRIKSVPFSMARAGSEQRRQDAWQASADEVVRAFADGCLTVAFATVGDPSVYSTFSYLAERVRRQRPDCCVSVVPGITAMQALAAASVTPLVEGQETLALVPVTAGLDALSHALDQADTVVAYKVGRHLPEVAALLQENGRAAQAVLGVNVGLPNEHVGPLTTESASYFSTVIVPAVRPMDR